MNIKRSKVSDICENLSYFNKSLSKKKVVKSVHNLARKAPTMEIIIIIEDYILSIKSSLLK